MLLQKMLEKTDCEILWAKDGQEAIDIANTEKSICLVLMDIRMPILDGIDATRIIHDTLPDLPIVAVTAFTLSNEKDKCEEAGAVGFLSKPVMPEELMRVVEKYVHS